MPLAARALAARTLAARSFAALAFAARSFAADRAADVCTGRRLAARRFESRFPGQLLAMSPTVENVWSSLRPERQYQLAKCEHAGYVAALGREPSPTRAARRTPTPPPATVECTVCSDEFKVTSPEWVR